jgi:type IV pilus assembly protein PilE
VGGFPHSHDMTPKSSAAEDGFTLIELVIVMTLLAILLTIPLASYLGYRDKANRAVARANVIVLAPSIEAYFADNSTYGGMTLLGLKANYDKSIDTSMYVLTDQTPTSYCVSSSVRGQAWRKPGPGALVEPGVCA